MNIHYDVTGLMTAVWKVTLRPTCLSCLSWPARRLYASDPDDNSRSPHCKSKNISKGRRAVTSNELERADYEIYDDFN